MEPFRLKVSRLIKDEDLHLNQIYNADETGLFWQLLPNDTQAFKDEKSTPRKKSSKEHCSSLLGVSSDMMCRPSPVVVGRSAHPQALNFLH